MPYRDHLKPKRKLRLFASPPSGKGFADIAILVGITYDKTSKLFVYICMLKILTE